MTLPFDDACLAAIERAKESLVEGQPLDMPGLLAALCHATELKERFPQLAAVLPVPEPRGKPEKAPLDLDLKTALRRLRGRTEPITPDALLVALLNTEAAREYLAGRGIDQQQVADVLAQLREGEAERAPHWRTSPQRRAAIESLSQFGRMLTDMTHRRHAMLEFGDAMNALLMNLSRMRNRSTIIVGFPGTGKTALVYELARRLVEDPGSIPPRLRELDLFELSPSFLRSGASIVGQYDERVRNLIATLRAHPKIVLFVDEIHSLLQSGMHQAGPFSEANESFKGPLARGEITVVGCTTLAEFRHYIEPDRALAERFSQIRLEPPSSEVTFRMLQEKRPQLEEYFRPLRISDDILRCVIKLTDDYLPGHYQPRKALHLLDESSAACMLHEPPRQLTETVVIETLENKIGRSLARRGHLGMDEVMRRLTDKIIGQDPVLRQIATAFVGGLSDWAKTRGPRAVFLFGGPTGVGKTETARRLAEILGGGEESLIRVDCNTLQGSGFDSGPAINRLLGVPPGYVGYARGQGGLLTRIRDFPECVVLFDEFEKTDPGVGKVLLQILDEGRVEDVDGNVLDFRRSFIVFTTNAGCTYETLSSLGFLTGKQAVESPTVETDAMLNQLRAIGLGEEFFGRIDYICLFSALDASAIERVIHLQLESLRDDAQAKGLQLEWDDGVVARLTRQWKPRFGVRALQTILRNQIRAQLGIAASQGEMTGVTRVRLESQPSSVSGADRSSAAIARFRDGDQLVIAFS